MEGRANRATRASGAHATGARAYPRASHAQRAAGLTAVELIIAIAVIASLVTAATLYYRQSQAAIRAADAQAERARLQALADERPYEVFNFTARPLNDRLHEGDYLYSLVEVANPTEFDLTFDARRVETAVQRETNLDHVPSFWAAVDPMDGTAIFDLYFASLPRQYLKIAAGDSVMVCLRTNTKDFRKWFGADKREFEVYFRVEGLGPHYAMGETFLIPKPEMAGEISRFTLRFER